MKQYVIHKAIREPRGDSYDGPTWDVARIRHLRWDTYDDAVFAEAIATVLTHFNPVGFSVSEAPTSAALGGEKEGT